MAAISKIKPGITLWDYHKVKMGNTNISREGEWAVRILEVDVEKNRALCSWNGNKPEWMGERRLSKFKVKRKVRS